jgi:tripartite ATP-independent transporter DctM subunit
MRSNVFAFFSETLAKFGIIGLLLICMLSGMPVAFGFMLVNVVGLFLWVGGQNAWVMLTLSAYRQLSSFALTSVVFFLLMGEVLYHTGMINVALDAVDKLIGRVRARLSLVALAAGTMLAACSGSSLGTTAALGTTLLPEMRRRGYGKPLSIGPIMGAGGLALLIPPTAMGVLLAAFGKIPIGKFLIAIIIPGLLLSAMYMAYIVIRAFLNPRLAPAYATEKVTILEKIRITGHLIPLGILFFLVIGTIFFGIATPTEASALGAVGALALAAAYRKLTLRAVKKSVLVSGKIVGMVFLIVMGSTAFGQVLAGSGVSRDLIKAVAGMTVSPWVILVIMQLLILAMGMIMDAVAIMMITLPLFMPIIKVLGFNKIWFGTIMLINIEIASMSPPFGMLCFVMKGISPPDVTMGDVYRSALPFMLMQLTNMGLVMAFPSLALWLPGIAAG